MRLKPVECAICGVDDSQKLYPANFSVKDLTRQTFSARRIPDRVHYRIVKCRRCGLVYSNPILDQKTIAKLYQSSHVNYEEQMEDLCETYGKYFFRSFALPTHNHLEGGRMDSFEVKVRKHSSTVRGVAPQHLGRASPKAMPAARGVFTGKHKTSPRVLEIGCGNGFFLEYLRKNGWTDVWGVEPSRAAVLKASKALSKRIVNSILRPNLFPRNSFDYICTFQTLDHVVEPNAFLGICYSLLRPGGKMLLINHDVASWSAKILGARSPIIDIEHVYLFDPQTMRLILGKNRFTAVKVFRVSDRHNLGYWVRMSPFPQASKRLVLPILERTRLARVPMSFPAGNLAVVTEK